MADSKRDLVIDYCFRTKVDVLALQKMAEHVDEVKLREGIETLGNLVITLLSVIENLHAKTKPGDAWDVPAAKGGN